LPMAHDVQLEAASAEYLPDTQTAHADAPDSEYFPAAHEPGQDEPLTADAYLPPSQEVQSVAPRAEYVPALQSRQ